MYTVKVCPLTAITQPSPQALPCAAEVQCADDDCVQSFKTDADDLPFTVSAEHSAKDSTTQFTFKVCSKSCKKDAATCQPLESVFLRLEPTMVEAVRYEQLMWSFDYKTHLLPGHLTMPPW